jgi:hypothetical protein
MRRDPVQGMFDSTLTRRVPQKLSGLLAFYAFDTDLSQGDTKSRPQMHGRLFAATFCCTSLALGVISRMRAKKIKRD